MMDLGDGNRDAVALPGLAEALPRPELGLQMIDPGRFDVDVGVPAVRSRLNARIAPDAVVEEPLARQIMVEADDVGRRLPGREFVELGFRGRLVAQPASERVAVDDAPGEQVEAEPAA